MPPRKYRAFISYSHADKRWGDWLHKALETYAIPKRLVGRTTVAGVIPKRLAPVFRDRDELPSATDLGSKVNDALAQSDALVVICSPRSAASRWVDEEVRAFKRMRGGERVFCLIVDGEPNASDLPGREAEECFAPSLRYRIDADGKQTDARSEPIAADARPGKDGKTNAKLKLLSGLLGVGFDELRQREQQRRMRRLAWTAGLALAGMLVTTGLSVFALRARDQARFQREQAEELVGFMLGNLRDKLVAVDRLDILDEVADHAMGYFDAQGDASGSPDSRAKHAEALLLIGRVRLDQGRPDDADKAFTESLRVAAALAAERPEATRLRFAVADARLWLGRVDWGRGDLGRALEQFRLALPNITATLQRHPDDEDGLNRLLMAHNNIGHVLEAQGSFEDAGREYDEVLELSQRLLRRHPEDGSLKFKLANAHDTLGHLLYSQGDLAGAEKQYSTERDLAQSLVTSEPRNMAYKVNLALAQVFLAQVADALGHADVARDYLRNALRTGEAMLADDPHNMDKLGDVASYNRRLARSLRLAGDPTAAAPLLERADMLYGQMLAQSPDDARARTGEAAVWLEQGCLAWQTGHASAARAHATAARDAYSAWLKEHADDRYASLGVAGVQVLLGKLDLAQGDRQDAHAAWTQALQALQAFGDDSRDPALLALRAEALQRLGHAAEAKEIKQRLAAMGYREREYLAWAAPAATQAPAVADAAIANRN